MNKRIVKYLILLLAYIVVVRFVEPYAIKFYFIGVGIPDATAKSVVAFQAMVTSFELLINLILAVFLIVDTKNKRIIDWLIIVITFFSPESGISIYIVWQFYQELSIKPKTDDQ